MSILRKASTDTKQLYLDAEQTEYLVVRSDLSKKEFNVLVAKMPITVGQTDSEGMTIPQATEFQKSLFEALVVGWTLDAADPTIADYEDLSAEGATAVDTALADHFASLLPTSAEGKLPTT